VRSDAIKTDVSSNALKVNKELTGILFYCHNYKSFDFSFIFY